MGKQSVANPGHGPVLTFIGFNFLIVFAIDIPTAKDNKDNFFGWNSGSITKEKVIDFPDEENHFLLFLPFPSYWKSVKIILPDETLFLLIKSIIIK